MGNLNVICTKFLERFKVDSNIALNFSPFFVLDALSTKIFSYSLTFIFWGLWFSFNVIWQFLISIALTDFRNHWTLGSFCWACHWRHYPGLNQFPGLFIEIFITIKPKLAFHFFIPFKLFSIPKNKESIWHKSSTLHKFLTRDKCTFELNEKLVHRFKATHWRSSYP